MGAHTASPHTQYRITKRKEFEDQIRRQRQHLGNFMKYAAWEESQNEFERARSVYERCVRRARGCVRAGLQSSPSVG